MSKLHREDDQYQTDMYSRLLADYHMAIRACDDGEGDFDLLWMRFESARHALNVYVQSVKRDAEVPTHDKIPLWRWWRRSLLFVVSPENIDRDAG